MKQIIKSEFVNDVNEVKMTRKELAAKYELPETEIRQIMKRFDLKISRKKHATYEIIDDTIVLENVAVEIAQEITENQNVFAESQIN